MMDFSPTMAMASRAPLRQSIYRDVCGPHPAEDECAKKNAEYDRMARTRAQVLAQIEERVCYSTTAEDPCSNSQKAPILAQ